MTTPPSNEYWQKRFENLTEALLKIGEDEYRNLIIEYDRAIFNLQRSIENFYYRFAEHNKVSYSDAKRILDKRELKEFQWTVEEYIERGIENALDQRWMNELENASIRIRMSRLESLQYQIRQQVELITARRLTSMAKVAEEIMHEGYYKSIYEIQKGFEISDYFNVLDKKTVENTISKPWTPDGKDFSERIWGDRDKLVAELEKELTHSFIRGDAPDQAINNIARVMNTSKKHAGRLVMTESAYVASASRVQAYKELGVEEYRISATLDLRTSEICQEMDGKVFKVSEYQPGVTANPFHPWCRTSTIPYFEGNIKSRFMRDPLTGKSGSTGEDISYKDWYQKYVVDKYGQEQADIMRKKLENETSDFEQYQRYKKLLGNDMPAKSFAEFQELKYNKVDEWKLTKYDYKLRNKALKDPSLTLKNSDALIVDEKKYTMYLFNPESKDGYPKGKAFESRLGYSAQNYADLDKLIKNNIGKYPINNRQETPHGEKCDVNMVLKGLKDKQAKVKAVVIYDKGQENPRLVTMYIDKLQDGDLKDD